MHPLSNMSDIIAPPDHKIMETDLDIVYPITTSFERKHLYTATISVVGSEGAVQVLTRNLSKLTESVIFICYCNNFS